MREEELLFRSQHHPFNLRQRSTDGRVVDSDVSI